ncbi:T6SS immunity protein Tli4 family protein [Paraburkholderia sp. SEWSISQ10-3 4]|uniref:T6SS immunity protein Tli4 family protein n=1 Tax=Paraburkholderia TaxID=1822464 RepID=UPI00225403BD|nr:MULTISPECIES: T6SS immunity protein Tli4 family protein [Paraburkholderia]MCX4140493.1 T6SS immunity protein Tli4 family protein [Paraburkholderia aspalathi]MDN7173178.1 T6SS immunity protein Tli4 family protein [Paraburkholderia sp. SEWSISQ10-3 4]MDQ6502819.1 T6SS immunity protein Tli4 family protein [Paraburkholderia aspalathi]
MTLNRHIWHIPLCVLLILLHRSGEAETVRLDTYGECVGRYELSLPGSVDFAVTTPEALFKETPHSIRFEDGEEAPHSVFSYNGVFRVTWQVPETDFNRRVEALRKKMAPPSAKANETNDRFEPYDLKRTDLVGWKVQEAAGFETYQGGRIFSFKDFENHDTPTALRKVARVASGFKSRQPYQIPSGAGVCLPYIFIADDGMDDFRKIGVTMRLKDHPDVTIFFLDTKALPSDPKLTSKQNNEFVWGYEYGIGKRIKLNGLTPYRAVKLDGREGVATSATITRDDDSTDYGYLATVQGDPNAPVDTPDLLLLVERNAKYAKGNPPVSAEELDQIAEGIAASIKRRPTR